MPNPPSGPSPASLDHKKYSAAAVRIQAKRRLVELYRRYFWTFAARIGESLGEIVAAENLIEGRAAWRREGKRVVAACGAFDLLHPGHVRLLEQARSLGDVLVVALEDDGAVRKAANGGAAANQPRPVTPLAERAEILAALAVVDFVVPLEHEPAEGFLLRLDPDIYVQGGAVNKIDFRASEGGPRTCAPVSGYRVVHIPLEPGYSTSHLIERIQNLRR